MKTIFLVIVVLLCFFALPIYSEVKTETGATTGTEIKTETSAETDVQNLGKKLQNPVAKLISVPFQNNFDFGLGPNDDGFRYTLVFQPVVPMSFNENWNFIARPIVPFISQHDVIGTTKQNGLGDIMLETFFSPKEIGSSGIIWGVGPIFLFPSATDDLLGSEKWGAGPCGVVLKQSGPWTCGILATQTWSFAGNTERQEVNSTFLEPFLSHTSKKGFTISASSESTYDWKAEQWTIPLIAGVSQVFPFCGKYASAGLSGVYYPETPAGGPEWGIRATLTFLFPEGSKSTAKK